MRWIYALAVFLIPLDTFSETVWHPLEVSPSERQKWLDPETNCMVTFLTSDPAEDANLYYEQRSWLADSSMILFTSSRERGGLMGCLTATGELVRITTGKGGLGGATCAKSRNSLFALRGGEVLEVSFQIQPATSPSCPPSRVSASERVICSLPDEYMPPNTSLSESSDGVHLGLGVGGRGAIGKDGCMIIIGIETGEIREVARVPGPQFGGHVMFSLTNPNLISFAESYHWLSVRDIRNGQEVYGHPKEEGGFGTHHCWWVDDTITFCGGFHPQPREDADVKVLDIHKGTIRIIGRGNWWETATSEELARCNWWHSCGYEGGQWVAADNWHGDIAVFDARTTRTHWVTRGHRAYGSGRHPEVGWDRLGKEVIFASHKQGNVDVAIAEVPEPR